eukprot:m.39599 g.39599  ORF g.39599 m.39599 type:complete len:163 (+) comp9572_c0_seq1:990-1478(+)
MGDANRLPEFWPIRVVIQQGVQEWNSHVLGHEAENADARVAVISPLDQNCNDTHHLWISVAPVDTLKSRIEDELNRKLNPEDADDKSAFEAMIAHLNMSELTSYPKNNPTIGANELTQLNNMFLAGDLCANGLFITGRGYAPALDSQVADLGDHKYSLTWTN